MAIEEIQQLVKYIDGDSSPWSQVNSFTHSGKLPKFVVTKFSFLKEEVVYYLIFEFLFQFVPILLLCQVGPPSFVNMKFFKEIRKHFLLPFFHRWILFWISCRRAKQTLFSALYFWNNSVKRYMQQFHLAYNFLVGNSFGNGKHYNFRKDKTRSESLS